ncbi:LD-carboxypeptidase [Sporolactobacillus shoreicorticis]|uniref:S66 peptidase family protein n=1 Tax=Sporolactobacillus shoreicorticis TaxID=1923877 RepID=A0ABW5S5Z8_9BACL|nr:S66 peptidase family protein [Sporolactobacillus shoreicorticis]MCO7125718.1 LD-carboxypeptidase [Sporolactobacillus shoreicorticis]
MLTLEKGDKIGIFSPSSPITATSPLRFTRAKHFLESKGFQIVEGCLTGKQDFYRSGTIEERAEELNELIRNNDIKMIMSTIGGTNSNSLLPYIDYRAFKRNPKIVIGYSDMTAILLAVYTQTGCPVFYGPALVPSFGEFPPFVDQTYRYFEQIVDKKSVYPIQLTAPDYWTEEAVNWEVKTKEKTQHENHWIGNNSGKVTGRLIGGNLNTMNGFWGSPYMPEIEKGDILLIEDSMKDASQVEKNFSLLKVNGVFERVSGILLGKHEQFDDEGTGRNPVDLLIEVLNGKNLPIIADFDCCHTHPMMTMPIGAQVTIDTDKKHPAVWINKTF